MDSQNRILVTPVVGNELIRVAIVKLENCFLPEAQAYCEYLAQQPDISPEIVEWRKYLPVNYEVSIVFFGFRPFWNHYSPIVIGEYNSFSTGRFARLKDFLKRTLNVRPNLYITQSLLMRQGFWLSAKTDVLIRPMGYPRTVVQKFAGARKVWDIVYCGTIRQGLMPVLERLAKLGFSIVVVGGDVVGNHSFGEKIQFVGRKGREAAFEIMAAARWGLNFTPDTWPYNVQDCTKVIEYCALGLGVITNRYEWIDQFERERGAVFQDIEAVENTIDISAFPFKVPDVSDLEWSSVIEQSGLVDAIRWEHSKFVE